MEINELKKILKIFDKNISYNKDLRNKNWFNIGGKAKVYFKADHLTDLIKFLKILKNREKIYIIGAGSNILITDEIYDGVIIKLGKNFNRLSLLNPDIIISGAGVLDKKLSDFAADNNLSGFEFLSCIPGTIGGGIKMNAGCFNREIKDILLSLQAVDKAGNLMTIPAKEINFEYRANNLPEDLIFLSASFKGKKKDKKKIIKKMIRLKSTKENNQPSKIKTSGSTFKNPIKQTEKKVWELIKESVPNNINFGDACISEKHSNFFINKGNASFDDMRKLINFVEKSVLKKTGINIEKEIKILEN
ncbi:UDP-N-acetylmuramate dehydrogenase [Candidatus Pelagibacter sp.]|nr:UDP-N-acetylmuramate dehydrogenase [Candidatus Pelagibacter sp.]